MGFPTSRRSSSAALRRTAPARSPGPSRPHGPDPGRRRSPGHPQRSPAPRPGRGPTPRPQRPLSPAPRPFRPSIPRGFRPRIFRLPGYLGLFQDAWQLGTLIGKLLARAGANQGLWPIATCSGSGVPSRIPALTCGGSRLFAGGPDPAIPGATSVYFWEYDSPFGSLSFYKYNGRRDYVAPLPVPNYRPAPSDLPAGAPYPGVPYPHPTPIPWVAPQAEPVPLAPLPAPVPVPVPLAPYRLPYPTPYGRGGALGPRVGGAVPWGVDAVAGYHPDGRPSGSPVIRPAPVPRAPPRPPVKEQKLNAPAGRVANALARLAGAASEANDFVGALWGALPPRYQTPATGPRQFGRAWGDRPFRRKWRDVYDNWDKINWAKALENLAVNEVEDRIVGRALGAANRADRRNRHRVTDEFRNVGFL